MSILKRMRFTAMLKELMAMAKYENVVSVILGGGAGTRLFPLTRERAKPAVPLGGKYRLVDVPISNCINSSITQIFILTQFNSASLNRHISRTYRFSSFSTGFVEVLAAEQRARFAAVVSRHGGCRPPDAAAHPRLARGYGFDSVGRSSLPDGLPQIFAKTF